MDKDYIHPNFNPSDKDEYLKLVGELRELCNHRVYPSLILVSQRNWDILEDAAHPTKKGHGHQVMGVEIQVANVRDITPIYNS